MDLRETSSFSKAIGSYAEIFYPKVGANVLQTPSNGLWNRLLERKVLSVLLVKFFSILHGTKLDTCTYMYNYKILFWSLQDVHWFFVILAKLP